MQSLKNNHQILIGKNKRRNSVHWHLNDEVNFYAYSKKEFVNHFQNDKILSATLQLETYKFRYLSKYSLMNCMPVKIVN